MRIQELKNLFDLSLSIDKEIANLQTRTCSHIINMLEDSPGIILGDDVGMGKTYIAIGTAIYYLYKNPEKHIIIVTPSWLLNDKWRIDISNFIEKNLKLEVFNLSLDDVKYITYGNDYGTYLNQIRIKSKSSKIIIIPANILSTISWKLEKSFYLSCWFRHRGFWEKTRQRILEALGGDVNVRNPDTFKNMGITYDEIDGSWYDSLNKIDISKNKLDQNTINNIWHEIKELRYKSLNKILPEASLLILDEAHKMKNEDTVRRQSLEKSLMNNFNKAIFLTATPFQLHDGELKSVMRMFESANIGRDKIQAFRNKVEILFYEMNRYKNLVNEFSMYVGRLSYAESVKFEKLIVGESIEDLGYDVNITYSTYKNIIEQKRSLEDIMRQIIVRNVKAKDKYRKEIIGSLESNDKTKADNDRTEVKEEETGIPLDKDSYLPFALMEKAIYELLVAGDRTFIASVKQSLTSSYEAAVSSSIYDKELPSLKMLRQMNIIKNKHPKINAVSEEVVSKLKDGEKTLIFCQRIETIKTLKKEIENRLNRSQIKEIKRLFPETGQKGFENYWKRFYNKQDVSWLLLQENYIYSVLYPVLDLCGEDSSIIPRVNEIEEEVEALYRRYNTTIKANYMYLKRIVEHLIFKKTIKKISNWRKKLPEKLKQAIENITYTDYIKLGLNLKLDDNEDEEIDDYDNESRNISANVINNIINYKGIWNIYRDKLNILDPVERDEIVNEMISFLRRDKRFFLELRSINERYPEKDDSFCVNRTFNRGDLLDWNKAYERFINNYINESTANREEMKLGLKTSDIVTTITGATSHDARKKIKAGFNTPFYPQILIATGTMQEGIDLQIECKRINHYDLEWNPASLEQRVGRIDRINSLTSKLRQEDKDITLDIYYPFIKNTIDESIYKTVKDREKWFNLILGGAPQWDTFDIDPQVTSISPSAFKSLQIDLSVKDKEDLKILKLSY